MASLCNCWLVTLDFQTESSPRPHSPALKSLPVSSLSIQKSTTDGRGGLSGDSADGGLTIVNYSFQLKITSPSSSLECSVV